MTHSFQNSVIRVPCDKTPGHLWRFQLPLRLQVGFFQWHDASNKIVWCVINMGSKHYQKKINTVNGIQEEYIFKIFLKKNQIVSVKLRSFTVGTQIFFLHSLIISLKGEFYTEHKQKDENIFSLLITCQFGEGWLIQILNNFSKRE